MNKKVMTLATMMIATSLALTGCGKAKEEAKVDETTSSTSTTTEEGTTNGAENTNENGSVTPKEDPVPADAVFAKTSAEAVTAFTNIATSAITAADKTAAGKAPTLEGYIKALSGINTPVSFTKLTAASASGKTTLTGESGKFKCSVDVSFSGKSKLGSTSCK